MVVSDSSRVPRGDVIAALNYYQPPLDESATPYNYIGGPAGEPSRNYTEAVHDTLIRDLRARPGAGADDFSLERDAFKIVTGMPPSAECDFADEDAIRRTYYPEAERLLLDSVSGASRVHIFDHTVRRASPNADRAPVTSVHVDQTPSSVEKRVRRYFPDEADALLSRRYRLVNVWRPLNKGPVESFPLAFASSSTLREKDVVPVEHRYADGYVGETAAIRYNPDQVWYYFSGMTGDERILLECFDSESLKPGSQIGGRVPHSAFSTRGRARMPCPARASKSAPSSLTPSCRPAGEASGNGNCSMGSSGAEERVSKCAALRLDDVIRLSYSL